MTSDRTTIVVISPGNKLFDPLLKRRLVFGGDAFRSLEALFKVAAHRKGQLGCEKCDDASEILRTHYKSLFLSDPDQNYDVVVACLKMYIATLPRDELVEYVDPETKVAKTFEWHPKLQPSGSSGPTWEAKDSALLPPNSELSHNRYGYAVSEALTQVYAEFENAAFMTAQAAIEGRNRLLTCLEIAPVDQDFVDAMEFINSYAEGALVPQGSAMETFRRVIQLNREAAEARDRWEKPCLIVFAHNVSPAVFDSFEGVGKLKRIVAQISTPSQFLSLYIENGLQPDAEVLFHGDSITDGMLRMFADLRVYRAPLRM